MTKRGRLRLIIVLVVLGIPLLVCIGMIGFVASGGLANRLEREYAAQFPGRLEIGVIELESPRHAVAHDLRLYGPEGGEPVVRIATADLQGGIFPPRLERIAVNGLSLRFDRDGVGFIKAILAQPRPPKGAGNPLRLHVEVDGEVEVAKRLALSQLRVAFDVDRWALDGRLSAQLSGQPFELQLTPASGGDPQRRSSRIHISSAMVDLGDLFGAITGLGILPDQDELLDWLPERASLAGADLVIDPAATTLTGDVAPTWEGGNGSTKMLIDRDGLHLRNAVAEDVRLGRGEGSLDVRFPDGMLTVDLARWQPGPRIPLPSAVPTGELLKLLPAARLELHPEGTRVSLWCLPAGGATDGQRVELRWRHNAPLTIEATGLPLPMVQGFMPEGLHCVTGIAQTLLVEWEDHLQKLVLTLKDAELEVGNWRLTRIDGSLDVLAVDPHDPTAGFSSRLDLPFGSLVHRGTSSVSDLELTVARLDELVDRVRGPVPLPRLSGLLKIVGRAEHTADGWKVEVKHLGLADVQSGGTFRAIAAAGKGSFTWNGTSVDTNLSGQLVSGEASLPSGWMDLCAHQPLFTTVFSIDGSGLQLRELLARAADRFAQPARDGFTAGLSGRLDADFSGRIDAVIDRIDLGWLTSAMVAASLPSESTATGESALTAALDIDHGSVKQILGWVLPLGVDVSLLKGAIEVNGVSGSVRFAITRPPAVPAKQP